MSKDGIELMNG